MDKKQYKVLKTFIDKNTKRRHKKGSKYKTDTERGELLKERGFLEDLPAKKADKNESKQTKA